MKRRYFSKEYKQKVVLDSYNVKSIKVLAAELGISPALLYT
jgi:transposase-like protein